MPDTQQITTTFIARVIRHDSARKGLAAGGAGVLIAVISEVLWPSS